MLKKFKNYFKKLQNSYYGKINFNFDRKPKRWELINCIIKKNNYEDYLEIGCFNDDCFKKIEIENKVGVDPIKGGTIRKSSDDFFDENKIFFDLIFIDGLHEYDQVKRDILNSIKFLKDGGTILCHDTLPEQFLEQTVPYSIGTWVGDVWKAIVEFRTFKDLDICVCTIDHGVSVIKKRINSNLLELDVKSFKDLKYKFYFKNYKQIMNPKDFNDTVDFTLEK